MNRKHNEPGSGVFTTALSDSESWITSLVRQMRELREERRNPPVPVEITAEKDMTALGKLLDSPSHTSSIFAQVRETFHDVLHPRKIETTAEPVEVKELWEKRSTGVSNLMSVGLHLGLVVLLIIPWASNATAPLETITNIALNTPEPLILNLPVMDDASGGGGGGGQEEETPPSLGQLPRADDEQFVPPSPEPPTNPDPALMMEPTIVAPQLAALPRPNLLAIGDPNGVPGPPSAGPGTGSGIGTGSGRGVGEGDGPGAGEGSGGGQGGGVFRIGGGVTAPVLIKQIMPEFSEEARKARYQGTVILDTIVRKDGSLQVLRVVRGLGFGLDENAIAAARQWRFVPGKNNGEAVDVSLRVEVNFTLR